MESRSHAKTTSSPRTHRWKFGLSSSGQSSWRCLMSFRGFSAVSIALSHKIRLLPLKTLHLASVGRWDNQRSEETVACPSDVSTLLWTSGAAKEELDGASFTMIELARVKRKKNLKKKLQRVESSSRRMDFNSRRRQRSNTQRAQQPCSDTM